MANTLKVKDNPPVYGMNNIDDPKTLRDGECVSLVNMFPGNPPKVRNGCESKLLNITTPNTSLGPSSSTLRIKTDKFNHKVYNIILTLYSPDGLGHQYSFHSVDEATGAVVLLENINQYGNAAYMGNFDAVFSNKNQFDFIYYTYIGNDDPALQSNISAIFLHNKVIESEKIIRNMNIVESASIRTCGGTAAYVGPFMTGDCFAYGFTYVRRLDDSAFETSTVEVLLNASNVIIPAKSFGSELFKGSPKIIEGFLPGACESIEDPQNRVAVQITEDNSSMYVDYIGSQVQEDKRLQATFYGATHLRVYRSRKFSNTSDALGATKFFLIDLPLTYMAIAWKDTISDAALSLETNQVFTANYTTAPEGGFIEYAMSRMWIFGRDGIAYYSEAPGGDGCTDLELANQYPQKWASLFKVTKYKIDLDSGDGLLPTGMSTLGDNLYFFKENKIFALFGSNPLVAGKTTISSEIGCYFPYTVTKADIPGLYGKCILFLSNKGPAVITDGGNISLISEFKIKELYPDYSDVKNLFYSRDKIDNTNKFKTMNSCCACFCKNTYFVAYTIPSQNICRIFGYYFDPDLTHNSNAPKGSFEIKLDGIDNSTLSVKDISFLKDDPTKSKLLLNLYEISNPNNRQIQIVDFLKDGSFSDKYYTA